MQWSGKLSINTKLNALKRGMETKMNNIDTMSVNAIRVLSADAIQKAKSGHPGLPLGCASVAYELWAKHLKHNPKDPDWKDRDRFILSGGHGSMLLYSLLHLFGYGDLKKEDLMQFRQWGSLTPGHPEYRHTVGVEATTGPLGAGMGMAVGMAIAKRNNNDNHHVYAILGDGEMQEGQIWESLLQAAHYKLNNLIVVIDYNKLSSFDAVNDSMNLEPLVDKIRAFNFHVIELDGNNMEQVVKGLNEAHIIKDKPVAIIANTVKGKGVSFMENNPKWHSGALSDEEYKIAMQELQMEEE